MKNDKEAQSSRVASNAIEHYYNYSFLIINRPQDDQFNIPNYFPSVSDRWFHIHNSIKVLQPY